MFARPVTAIAMILKDRPHFANKIYGSRIGHDRQAKPESKRGSKAVGVRHY